MQSDTAQATLFVEHVRHNPVQVIGVGDAGCRAASEIWRRRIRGVSVTGIDTDALSLDRSQTDRNVLLGAATLHGFGSGGDVDAVASAARAQAEQITDLVSGATCVIVIAGLTGGTGAGAASVVAEAARAAGALVVGIPITPLAFEPIKVHLAAADSLTRLRRACDGVLEIPRHSRPESSVTHGAAGIALRQIFNADRSFAASFVATVATVVNAGPDRCDASAGDLRAILREGVPAIFGTATGFGHTGAAEATQTCLDAAFTGIDRSCGIERAVVLIESGPDIPVSHIATVTSLIETRIGSHAELHTAVRRSRLLGSNIRVSIIGCVREVKRPGLVAPFRPERPLEFEPSAVSRRVAFRTVAVN